MKLLVLEVYNGSAAVCGLKNVDLTKDAVKIITISFSYIKAIQNELNFRTIIS